MPRPRTAGSSSTALQAALTEQQLEDMQQVQLS